MNAMYSLPELQHAKMPPGAAPPAHYIVVNAGPFAYYVLDVRTGAKGRTWRSEQEARIDMAGILVRNLMHS